VQARLRDGVQLQARAQPKDGVQLQARAQPKDVAQLQDEGRNSRSIRIGRFSSTWRSGTTSR
jgi:hypothetical protein